MVGTMELRKIGTVERRGDRTLIVLDAEYREGLKGLDEFSHCHALWWSGEDFGMGIDTRSVLTAELPYAPGKRAGVFACRGPFRPNLIAMTVCPIRGLDAARGEVEVAAIDAMDGTTVLDIKPYYPSVDRVRNARVPAWLPDWGEWVPDGGFGMED